MKKTYLIIGGVIIVILVGIGVLAYSIKGSIAELRDEQRMEDLRNLKLSLTIYYLDNKKYPEQLQELAPKYIFAIPKDPSNGNAIKEKKCARLLESDIFIYKYISSNDNKKFTLRSCLENQNKLFLVSSYE